LCCSLCISSLLILMLLYLTFFVVRLVFLNQISQQKMSNTTTLKLGDWICTNCNTTNFARRTSCHTCTTPKSHDTTRLGFDEYQVEGMGQSQLDITVKSGDWICQNCSHHNFAARDTCRQCDQNKNGELHLVEQQNEQVQVEPKNGDWTCYCGELNFASRENCRKCNSLKPSVNVTVSTYPDWICNTCGVSNFASRNDCRSCNSQRILFQVINPELMPKARSPNWSCSCGESNFGSRTTCRRCESSRVDVNNNCDNVEKKGDWNCSCGEMNFASRNACRKCGSAKVVVSVNVSNRSNQPHQKKR